MAKRVFLHVGTPKSGTTYLQRLLWSNKAALEEQGLLLPLQSVRDHFFLSNLGRAATTDIANMPPKSLTSWDRMMDEVSAWPNDVLISHELFAMTLPPRAEWIIDALRSVGDEVHLIITARDLARQVPAEWQQSVKHGRTHTLREFYGLIRAQDLSILFWRAQELPTLVRTWSQGLPPQNFHVVTVPPRGDSSDALWTRFASVVGVDPDSVEAPVELPNVSLGLVEVEMLRRVNVLSPQGATKPLQQRMIREILGDGILAQRKDAMKFAPPAEEHPWVVEFGTATVSELRSMSFDVVGDLDDLIPPPEPMTGRVPDDVEDSEVAAVAIETISEVLYRSQDKEVMRLKGVVRAKSAEISELEGKVAAAWRAYEHEKALPLWRQVARRVRSAGKSVIRRKNA